MSATLPEILSGEYAPARPPSSRTLRVIDWNIDRGENYDGILEFLRRADADLLLLQEVDVNDRRTKRRNVSEELARALKLNFVWAREFQELVQGTDESPAYTGQATLSRWPIANPRLMKFRNQSGFWHPHWFVPHVSPFQVRVGGRIGLLGDMEIAGRKLVTYNLHLESRNTDRLRAAQLAEVLKDASRYDARTPVVIAGDFNMNVRHPEVAKSIQEAGFRPVLPGKRGTTHLWTIVGPAIDWVFLRGPAQASDAQIHSSVHASDHFPISFQLNF